MIINKISGYDNYQNKTNFTGANHFIKTAQNEYAPLCHSMHEYLKMAEISNVLNDKHILLEVNAEFSRLLPLERDYSLFTVLNPKKQKDFCEIIGRAKEGDIISLDGFLVTVDAASQADDMLKFFSTDKSVTPMFCEIFTSQGAQLSRKNVWYYAEHIFPMDSNFKVISKQPQVITRNFLDGLFIRSFSNPLEQVKMEYIKP